MLLVLLSGVRKSSGVLSVATAAVVVVVGGEFLCVGSDCGYEAFGGGAGGGERFRSG